MADILSGDDDEFAAEIEAELAKRPTKLATLQVRVKELEADRDRLWEQRDEAVAAQVQEQSRCIAAEAQLAAVREALENILMVFSLGPLGCAAKYGPDVDLREVEATAVEQARRALIAPTTEAHGKTEGEG